MDRHESGNSSEGVPEPTEEEQCPTLPFEDDELRRIYDGLPKYIAERTKSERGKATDSNHPRRLEVLIRMEHSGLAIGDATRLDTGRLTGDRLFLRRMKARCSTPRPVARCARKWRTGILTGSRPATR